jgi:hypothetical protein
LDDPRVRQLLGADMPFVTIGHAARPEGTWWVDGIALGGVTGVEYPCGDDALAGDECAGLILEQHPEITAAATVNEAALPGVQRAPDRRHAPFGMRKGTFGTDGGY